MLWFSETFREEAGEDADPHYWKDHTLLPTAITPVSVSVVITVLERSFSKAKRMLW